jgi:hypothetical protein
MSSNMYGITYRKSIQEHVHGYCIYEENKGKCAVFYESLRVKTSQNVRVNDGSGEPNL